VQPDRDARQASGPAQLLERADAGLGWGDRLRQGALPRPRHDGLVLAAQRLEGMIPHRGVESRSRVGEQVPPHRVAAEQVGRHEDRRGEPALEHGGHAEVERAGVGVVEGDRGARTAGRRGLIELLQAHHVVRRAQCLQLAAEPGGRQVQ